MDIDKAIRKAESTKAKDWTPVQKPVEKYDVIKLDRQGNVIPPNTLKEVIPGVAVGPNYKPGRDPAVDALLQKLARDGADSLDSSGFGGSVGGDLQRIMND